MQRIVFLFLVLVSVSALYAEPKSSPQVEPAPHYTLEQLASPEVIPILFHGVKKGGRRVKDDTTITGWITLDPEITEFVPTDRIPLLLNNGLCCGLILQGKYRGLKEVTLEVEHPEMVTPEGKVLKRIKRQQPTFQEDGDTIVEFGFFYDHPWEMQPGLWKVTFSSAGIVIGQFQFQAYEPVKRKGDNDSEPAESESSTKLKSELAQ